MPFKKGESGNIKGRPKGAKDKNTREARELFLKTLEGQVDKLAESFDKVRERSPEKYLDLFARYAQFFMPKKTESDIKREVSSEFNFNEAIKRLRE
ncbi:MAG: hypothetical protein DCO96_06575 [Fluviicola sp. XM-24bin1]|nr:MAG: hypothetical protein DCO96_06575 [Fluviicola sp. XM-24bin1]